MVFFTCNACGSSLKKNQVEKHYRNECRNCSVLSCMDCGQDFYGDEYAAHTKCISEAEKYQGAMYKSSGNKGDQKQESWLEKARGAIQSASVSPKLASLLNRLMDYPNIPRKKKKFENMVRNSCNVRDQSTLDQLWDIINADTQEPGPIKAHDTGMANGGQTRPEGKVAEGDLVTKVTMEDGSKEKGNESSAVINGESKTGQEVRASKKKRMIEQAEDEEEKEKQRSQRKKRKVAKDVDEDLNDLQSAVVELEEKDTKEKKSKQRKKKDLQLASTCDSTEAVLEEDAKEKRNKRKRKKDSHTEAVDNGVELESQENDLEKRSERKRRKVHVGDSTEVMKDSVEPEIENSKDKRSKKKRKKLSCIGGSTENGLELKVEESSAKKVKKCKEDKTDPNAEETELNNDADLCLTKAKKLKKKQASIKV